MTENPAPTRDISLTVNGRAVRRTVPVRRLLVDFLREDLVLTGTHAGCEHGICGACTVLVDGEPARSCITLAVQADGCEVVTVEGLTPEDGLSPLQQAFKDCHGLQCGFCTPGFLVTVAAASPDEHPTDPDIRELLSGNLCRCTGYQHIVDSVKRAWGRS
ncbi:(2Fe-2S)-binding protein [Saccharopolyspora rhizosphaerae]|uniref:(2Fe-2S)-binding protein n=1 Tax=Saccharopolyspora rhizosphaerae TaxID=2492662 RepID=A0A3R8VMC2_9PSEU|nr:(2Fe-2S)-binding protein [Saccharopolyspora rhizosphaerae]RRO20621.1 (2Fe-2S)-binding protein [Saccharopolyspora rhizosphaerae]